MTYKRKIAVGVGELRSIGFDFVVPEVDLKYHVNISVSKNPTYSQMTCENTMSANTITFFPAV